MSSDLTPKRMPTFTMLAKDALILPAIRRYQEECFEHGLEKQAAEVGLAMNDIRLWQKNHIEETKLPDHYHRREENPPFGFYDVLQEMIDWFQKHDDKADDFGRLNFVAYAERLLEERNARP